MEADKNRIDWDLYFISLAQLTSLRSPDPSTKVGCVIADQENKVVGVGYNGTIHGINLNDVPWDNSNDDPLLNKYLYVVHSEINAICNSDSTRVRGSKLYCSLAPCSNCAKTIVQSKIAEVIYLSDKYADKPDFIAGKILLDLAKIKHRLYTPLQNELLIKF